MARMMGFSSLSSTSGKKVQGNVDPKLQANQKKRRYRCGPSPVPTSPSPAPGPGDDAAISQFA